MVHIIPAKTYSKISSQQMFLDIIRTCKWYVYKIVSDSNLMANIYDHMILVWHSNGDMLIMMTDIIWKYCDV